MSHPAERLAKGMRVSAWGLCLAISASCWAQTPRGATDRAEAQIETAPLELRSPAPFLSPARLGPIRQVTLVATQDALVQALPSRIGTMLREREQVVELDPRDAMARMAIAQAGLKEAMARQAVDAKSAVTEAQIAAAQARVDLAQLDFERCTLRTPFAGQLVAYHVGAGEFVTRGQPVATVADVSSFLVLLPVDRVRIEAGQSIPLEIEGQRASGTVAAVVPLPDAMSAWQELPTAWGLGRIEVTAEAASLLEPGLRVANPYAPTQPLAVVPARALRSTSTGTSLLQVVRQGQVVDLPVRSFGTLGPNYIQVEGAFESGDVALVSSSVPIVAGTQVRFGDSVGSQAAVSAGGNASSPPSAATAPATRVAPIAAPASPTAAPPPRRPGTVPF